MRIGGATGIGVVVRVMLLAGGLSTIQAADNLGESCWQSPDGGYLRAAVTDMGRGHFLLNGGVVQPNQGPQPAIGNAEVVRSQVYLTLTVTGADANDTRGSVGRITPNLPSLNGSVVTLEIDHSTTDPTPPNVQVSYHSAKMVTFIPCP